MTIKLSAVRAKLPKAVVKAADQKTKKMLQEMKLSEFTEDSNHWDNRELGADARYVRLVSKDEEKRIEDAMGLQMISIRLPKGLIEMLGVLAWEEGDMPKYQPYIRRVLIEHVKSKSHHSRRDGTHG